MTLAEGAIAVPVVVVPYHTILTPLLLTFAVCGSHRPTIYTTTSLVVHLELLERR